MKNFIIPLSAALILICFANCSEEPITPDTTNTIDKIIVKPRSVVAPVDSTIQFTAYGIYQNSDTLQINAEWFSDDTMAVSINSNGIALCKNHGDAFINATYQGINSSNGPFYGAYIEVIPKRKIISQFLIGQTQGNDVGYVDIEPDLVIPWTSYHHYEFDLDNYFGTEFTFYATGFGSNNADIIFLINASENNKVAINLQYQSIADSILYSEVDSNDTYNLPWNPEYFANWVEDFYEGDTLTNVTNWHTGYNTFFYHYVRDGSMYSSPNYGLFHDGEEKYMGMLFYNRYGYPIYCWFKIQFDTETFGYHLILKEYAFAPKY